MSYRKGLHTSIKHLQPLGNVSLRGVTYGTNIPVTGTPVTDVNRTAVEYEHFPLPTITLYTVPDTSKQDFPLDVEISSYHEIDEIWYRISGHKNWSLYTDRIRLYEPTTIEYYGIRLSELSTQPQTSTFELEIDIPTIRLYINLQSGMYPEGTYITCYAESINSTIYYEIGGYEPTSESSVYTEPILMADGENIYRFIVINNDDLDDRSEITTRYYTVAGGIGRMTIGSTFVVG